jgi:hypothetical protein
LALRKPGVETEPIEITKKTYSGSQPNRTNAQMRKMFKPIGKLSFARRMAGAMFPGYTAPTTHLGLQ